MSIDIYKFRGKGIKNLEKEVVKFLTSTEWKNLNDYAQAEELAGCLVDVGRDIHSKIVKFDSGMCDKYDDDVPGHVVYIPDTVCDLLDLSDEEVKDNIREVLREVIGKFDNLTLDEAAFENLLDSIEMIDEEGAFY